MTHNHEWTWNKQVPTSIWHKLALYDYPGWHKDEQGEVLAAYITHTFGPNQIISREFAIQIDDLITGQFYYRDFTQNGIPWGDDGEQYVSAFYFQLLEDFKLFCDHFNITQESIYLAQNLLKSWR